MKKIQLFLVFLLFLVSPGKALKAESIRKDLEKYKNRFNEGTLKDFTPKEISGELVSIQPNGPFFMVAGIERTLHSVDIRPPDQREKITFSLREGKGSFAILEKPNDKNNQSIVTVPYVDGSVVVLLYPDASNSAGEFIVDVSVAGVTGITGHLKYTFRTVPINESEFQSACKQYSENEEKRIWLPRKEYVNSTLDEYDQEGKSIKREKKEKNYLLINPDQTLVRYENDIKGKKLSEKKKNSNIPKDWICTILSPWGESESNYIFVQKFSTVRGEDWEFNLIDRKNFILKKSITLAPMNILAQDYFYEFNNGVPVLMSEEKDDKHLWGGISQKRHYDHVMEK